MSTDPLQPGYAIPDASLIAKWYTPDEPGWEHARLLRDAFAAGALRLVAPEHMKVEAIRVIQLGVREKRYELAEGIERMHHMLSLPITYVANDALFEQAFRAACMYQIALYDALYVALAQALDSTCITADRRLANLARQRHLTTIMWYEDVLPRTML